MGSNFAAKNGGVHVKVNVLVDLDIEPRPVAPLVRAMRSRLAVAYRPTTTAFVSV